MCNMLDGMGALVPQELRTQRTHASVLYDNEGCRSAAALRAAERSDRANPGGRDAFHHLTRTPLAPAFKKYPCAVNKDR